MASGGKRGAGERVLEGRHVIGLFFLMLLFSGVFFTLGFVMGRNQYSGNVRAANSAESAGDAAIAPKSEAAAKHSKNLLATPPSTDPAAQPAGDWTFYDSAKPKDSEEPLRPAPPPPAPKNSVAPAKASSTGKAGATKPVLNAATLPGGSYTLQVAALRKEADALALASNLQKKNFHAFVLTPHADRYYRVQVGPYPDQKSAAAAQRGLDAAGFKAIVKH